MQRVELVAIALSLGLLLLILELVRRRRLTERYSLLWLLTGVILLALSIWQRGLGLLARALGIYYSPTALMVVSVAFILLILLHFSVIISALAARHKDLAQHHAILAWRVAELEQSRPEMDEREAIAGMAERNREPAPRHGRVALHVTELEQLHTDSDQPPGGRLGIREQAGAPRA